MSSASLDALFRPRSVAVVGASRRRGTIAGEIFHNLIAHEFPGAVYPVNSSCEVVQSVRAYPSVRAIPDPVDLAILVVPKDRVLAAIDDCAAKRVRGVVVISAGFGETGPEGKALQEELVRKIRAAGIRLVGPNCMGLINTEPEFRLAATFAPSWPVEGGVAFSSQSGALGLAVLDHAKMLGMGFRHFVSVGNKADVSGNDLLEYWEDDTDTRVILFYLESLGNPQRFMQIARRVSRKKPIVVVKSGRTDAGARAASSHTGSLAGLDVAVDALLGQAGVLRTDTIGELFDVALLLANQPVPAGNRVAIVTNAGGPGIMASDACESHGLVVPMLDDATVAELARFLPPEASLRNPVDMIASATAEHYERALRLALADPNIDAVIVLFVPPIATTAPAVAEAIRRAAEGAAKPIVTCFMGAHGLPEVLSGLQRDRLPSFAFPEPAAIALSRAVRYGRLRQRPLGALPAESPAARAATARLLDDACRERAAPFWLGTAEVEAVLSAYGIATPPTRIVKTLDEARHAAKELGFPLAAKLQSATITHKSELGGVELDLPDGAAVAAAFTRIRDGLVALGRAEEMTGLLLQRMVPRGVETFVGATRSESYGPLIAFGLGGVNVELWKDVVFRVNPITDRDAQEMLDDIRGHKLLDGFRGSPAADRAALVDVLLKVSQLMADHPRIEELDLNPLIAHAPGEGAVVADARIRVSPGR